MMRVRIAVLCMAIVSVMPVGGCMNRTDAPSDEQPTRRFPVVLSGEKDFCDAWAEQGFEGVVRGV